MTMRQSSVEVCHGVWSDWSIWRKMLLKRTWIAHNAHGYELRQCSRNETLAIALMVEFHDCPVLTDAWRIIAQLARRYNEGGVVKSNPFPES